MALENWGNVTLEELQKIEKEALATSFTQMHYSILHKTLVTEQSVLEQNAEKDGGSPDKTLAKTPLRLPASHENQLGQILKLLQKDRCAPSTSPCAGLQQIKEVLSQILSFLKLEKPID